MNEINYTQGMWVEMETYYNQYRLSGMYGSRAREEMITMMAQTFLDRADEVIIIDRPDNLSPRKEVMKHTMD